MTIKIEEIIKFYDTKIQGDNIHASAITGFAGDFFRNT